MLQLTNVYDHIPLKLNQDDLERVCWIPKQKVLPVTFVGMIVVTEVF